MRDDQHQGNDQGLITGDAELELPGQNMDTIDNQIVVFLDRPVNRRLQSRLDYFELGKKTAGYLSISAIERRFVALGQPPPSLKTRIGESGNLFSWQMEIGSSTSLRVQLVSQGWVQTRPRTAGKGASSLIKSMASLYLPFAMSAT